jgi:hypothetical protein
MLTGLTAKFSRPDLREKLAATGNALLVEDNPYDPYWGVGRHRDGKNRLGVLLMLLRKNC